MHIIKTTISATVCVILFSTNTLSQTLENKIETIHSKYELIMKAVKNRAYKIKSIKFDCPDYPAYGHLTFYSEGSELRMIELENDDGSHSGETHYYFIWDQKLIFCYVEGSTWSFDFNGQDTTVIGNDTIYKTHTQDDIYEERYYFSDGKPIRCLNKQFQTHSSQENNPTSETTTSEEVDCDAENIMLRYSNLLKLNAIILKKTACPDEILDSLNN